MHMNHKNTIYIRMNNDLWLQQSLREKEERNSTHTSNAPT